jgi:site-specific DNA-methyltransferase (adenine-specific)
MNMNGGKIIHGDFLAESDRIENGSVDLILTDPPYGTVQGLEIDGWDEDKTEWDETIPPKKIFDTAKNLLRRNGRLILFCQEPFTSRLIQSAPVAVGFSYKMIWKKSHFANPLGCDESPVNMFEDIAVFKKEHDTNNAHPSREYFERIHDYIGASKAEIINQVGERADHCFRYDSSQFSLCTQRTYESLIETYGIDRMHGFKPYPTLNETDQLYKKRNEHTFNLPDGEAFKTNIFEYHKPKERLHPTQKPVKLLEDLIRTFSDAGDLVVDLTAGSGSTGIAAENTDREYIMIEKDADYHAIMKNRLNANEKKSRSMPGQRSLATYTGD